MKQAQKGWQHERSRINHDWLKNQYLPALAALRGVLGGDVDCGNLEGQVEDLALHEWPARGAAIERLVAGFDQHMSPRALFDRPPLDACESQTMEWLPDLVDELWRIRYPVDEWKAHAMAAVIGCRAERDALVACLASFRRPYELEQVKGALTELHCFTVACQQLARAIEQFPSRILVT